MNIKRRVTMEKFRYVPKTQKDKLIYQICQLAPNYLIGENREILMEDDIEDLQHILKMLKNKR